MKKIQEHLLFYQTVIVWMEREEELIQTSSMVL